MIKYGDEVRDIILRDNQKPAKQMNLSLSNVCLGMTYTYAPDPKKPSVKKRFKIVDKTRIAPEFIKHLSLLEKSTVKLGEAKSKTFFNALLEGKLGNFEELTVPTSCCVCTLLFLALFSRNTQQRFRNLILKRTQLLPQWQQQQLSKRNSPKKSKNLKKKQSLTSQTLAKSLFLQTAYHTRT